MRKSVFFIFAFLFCYNVDSQVVKNVVVEHFTNTRCGICSSKNPGFYSNLWAHPNILHISFHPSAPYSNCYLNNLNPVENDDRTKYYNVYGGTPRFVIQGNVVSSSTNINNPSLFTPYAGQTTEAGISINQTKFAGDSIVCEIVVKTESVHSYGNLRLFAALVEDTVAYDAPNGEDLHYDVFRKALSNIEGDVFLLPSSVGDSLVFRYSAPFNFEWNIKRIYTLVIIQDEINKDVVQVNASHSDPAGTPVGLPEQNRSFSVDIIPNPASENVVFRSESIINFIRIYDIHGVEMLRVEKFNQADFLLNLSDYSPGLYFVELIADGKQSIKKLVVN